MEHGEQQCERHAQYDGQDGQRDAPEHGVRPRITAIVLHEITSY